MLVVYVLVLAGAALVMLKNRCRVGAGAPILQEELARTAFFAAQPSSPCAFLAPQQEVALALPSAP